MTARTVNVNVTDDVISLDPESDAFIGGRAFNLHALPDDFQVKIHFIAGHGSALDFQFGFIYRESNIRVKHLVTNLVFLTVKVTDCYSRLRTNDDHTVFFIV